MNESFIAIDWGSTNLRAWLYKQGLCMDSLNSESGVTRLQGQTPQQVFSRLMQPWFQEYGELPTLMAGMVGSNAGWQAVPYLPCPVSLGEIAHHLTPVHSPNMPGIHIIPGLCIDRPDNSNVMRERKHSLSARTKCTHPLAMLCLAPTVNGYIYRVTALMTSAQ